MRAAELRDRVVAVTEEDALVELRRALALRALNGRNLRHRVCELVEEEPPKRPLVPGVAGEERALDGLREVDEPEDRPVEVREVRREALALLAGEGLDRNCHACHRGQRTAHPTTGLGRDVRLVVSQLAARLLPRGHGPGVVSRVLRRAVHDGRAEHDRLPAAVRGSVQALGRAGAGRVRVRTEASRTPFARA